MRWFLFIKHQTEEKAISPAQTSIPTAAGGLNADNVGAAILSDDHSWVAVLFSPQSACLTLGVAPQCVVFWIRGEKAASICSNLSHYQERLSIRLYPEMEIARSTPTDVDHANVRARKAKRSSNHADWPSPDLAGLLNMALLLFE
jgi:hypothetical protein